MPAQFPSPTPRDAMPLPPRRVTSLRLIQIMYRKGRIEMAARTARAGSIIRPSNDRSQDPTRFSLPAPLVAFGPRRFVVVDSDGTRASFRRLIDAPFGGTHRLFRALATGQHLGELGI